MVYTFIWIAIIILFVLSFIGLIYPFIPSVILIWLGFILYHLGLNSQKLTIFFWIIMGIFTIILLTVDILANSYFVKKFGGSKWGEQIAGIAVIIGSFIMPPLGIIIVPFISVIVVELLQNTSFKKAFFISIGSLIGFLSGTFAKIIIQLIMIIWFFIVVFI